MPTIDLCGEEVLDAINSLDTYSRVWMGQFSHLDLVWRMWRFTTYSQSRESRICEELLMGMRALFVPEAAVLGRGTSLGIWSDKVNELAVCAYDMQQVIRHDWSWFNEPEGDHMSRWFDEPYLHGSLPVPSTECHLLDDGSSAMRLSLEGSSLRLLLDALLAYDHLLALRVVALMQLYTRDDRVLAIAQMVGTYCATHHFALTKGWGSTRKTSRNSSQESQRLPWLTSARTTDRSRLNVQTVANRSRMARGAMPA